MVVHIYSKPNNLGYFSLKVKQLGKIQIYIALGSIAFYIATP